MIVRTMGLAAIHGAAGVAMGVTAALALCTVAQVARKGVEKGTGRPVLGPDPFRPMPTPQDDRRPPAGAP